MRSAREALETLQHNLGAPLRLFQPSLIRIVGRTVMKRTTEDSSHVPIIGFRMEDMSVPRLVTWTAGRRHQSVRVGGGDGEKGQIFSDGDFGRHAIHPASTLQSATQWQSANTGDCFHLTAPDSEILDGDDALRGIFPYPRPSTGDIDQWRK